MRRSNEQLARAQEHVAISASFVRDALVRQTVTTNMFTIYETLLGLKFEEVDVPEQLRWHPEVGNSAQHVLSLLPK